MFEKEYPDGVCVKEDTKNHRVVQYESAHNKPVGTG